MPSEQRRLLIQDTLQGPLIAHRPLDHLTCDVEVLELRFQRRNLSIGLASGFQHSLLRRQDDILRQEADAQAARADHLAALGSQFAGDGAQQRGFARAVGTDEADAGTRVADGPGEIAENLAPEEIDGEVMEGGDVHAGMIAAGRGIILTVPTSTGVNMMRALLSLLLLFTTGLATAQETVVDFIDHPARVVTNINALNMRSSPAIEADNIVGRLQPGQQVHVLAREGDWQQVRSEDGLLGWSHSDYLIDLPPRELGETRRFRFHDPHSKQWITVDARLQYIGQHSYIYSSNFVGFDRIGKLFDEQVYPETMALWDIDPKPSHEGDERIVILYYPSGVRCSGTFFSVACILGVKPCREEPNPYGKP